MSQPSPELLDAIDRETQAAYARGAETVWAMLGCGLDDRFPNVAVAIVRDLPDGDAGSYLPQYEIMPKASLRQRMANPVAMRPESTETVPE
jgi:hypothetical protein